jgi:nicotinamide riboside kinase
MIRIAIIGPECSGKTALAEALADYFQVEWFEEYAREYLTKTNGIYEEQDLIVMAKKQDEIRSNADLHYPVLIYDTENITFKIWSAVKYGQVSPEIETLVNDQQFDYYFLCSPEGIAWQEDPLRESPNTRPELFSRYRDELKERNLPFTVLRGSLSQRMDEAADIIDELNLSCGGFCV